MAENMITWYALWLAAVSLVTFVLYGFDKAQSKNKGWRVPEVWLHGLASKIPSPLTGEV